MNRFAATTLAVLLSTVPACATGHSDKVNPPPPGAHRPVKGADGRYENCQVLHEGYCYAKAKDACSAAGCADDCAILRTEPGQVGCEKEQAPPAGAVPSAAEDAVAKIDALVETTIAYTEKMMTLLPAYDGDCAAFAERMLTLEPLTLSIRSQMKAMVEAGADSRELARETDRRLKEKKAEVMPRIEAKLAEMGSSLTEFEAKAERLQAECASHPRFNEVMARVGLFKKKD